ncbi:MAG: transglutaminase family protein [Novosphingobium sp.]|nr:transglutaminase family protein [Novosphingobium sp.]
MRISFCHTTRYEFSEPVVHGLQRLRMKPKSTHGQEVREWKMELDGAVLETEYDDEHFNHTALVSVQPGVQEVTVTCSGTVDTSDNAGVIGQHAGHMPLWCFLRTTPLTKPGPKIKALVSGLEADSEKTLDVLHALSTNILGAVTYETGRTDSETTAEEALAAGHGVCQDHAHIFIAAGRLLEIPMRYVSGYLMMDDRVEQEAGHGWAEAHVEGLGWVGFDVSNCISPDERYIRVATGCDYGDAAPVTGIAMGAGESELKVHLAVEQQQVDQ